MIETVDGPDQQRFRLWQYRGRKPASIPRAGYMRSQKTHGHYLIKDLLQLHRINKGTA